jgi:hypothetical protein
MWNTTGRKEVGGGVKVDFSQNVELNKKEQNEK